MSVHVNGAGAVSAVVSILVALVVMLLLSPPWSTGTVVIAVGLSAYASGYFVAAAT